MSLHHEVQIWTTPRANCCTGASQTQTRQGAPDLQTAVTLWPTPTQREYKGGRKRESLMACGRSKTNTLSDAVEAAAQLNPDWVDWLMGFPVGWSDIDRDIPFPPPPGEWWPEEPKDVPRVAKGVGHRKQRLQSDGNAVCPPQFYPLALAIMQVQKGLEAEQ